jgi:hypothetical protein
MTSTPPYRSVVPVPFVGTRWVDRGAGYWWRRIGGTVLLLLGFAVIGGASVWLAVSLLTGSSGMVIGAIWLATVLPGLWTGWRRVRRLPRPPAREPRSPRLGCLILVLLPYTAGLCLALFLAALRPQFLGETRARTQSRR